MSRLADIQERFIEALRAGSAGPPPDVIGSDGERPERRFSVYRNNVHVSLVEVLVSAFPAVERLVGEEFFRAMARAYVGRELPRTPVLIHYGDTFPDFIDTFGPAQSLPYLSDVARLEWAWLRAYHAADARPIDPQALASVDPDRVDALVFSLHPSLQVLRSEWPVLSIWQTNRGDEEVRSVDLHGGGQDIVVIRPDLEVEVRGLPAGGYRFLTALSEECTLGEASAVAQADDAAFDLAANLQGILHSGGVIDFRVNEDGQSEESS